MKEGVRNQRQCVWDTRAQTLKSAWESSSASAEPHRVPKCLALYSFGEGNQTLEWVNLKQVTNTHPACESMLGKGSMISVYCVKQQES